MTQNIEFVEKEEKRSSQTPSLFLDSLPFQPRAWDNTMLSVFKDCPRKFYLAFVRGLNPRLTAAPLRFGQLLHQALEHYDALRLQGHTKDAALHEVIKNALLYTTSRVYVVRDINNQIVYESADGDDETLDKYPIEMISRELRFWDPQDKNRSRYTLVRTIVWYADQFNDDIARTIELPNGQPAVEVSFTVPLPIQNPDGSPYLYAGHIDKICEINGELSIQERKHTTQTLSSNYFAQYSPNSQISGYIYAANVGFSVPVRGAVIDAAQIAQTFSRFSRAFEHRGEDQMAEWLISTVRWIKIAEDAARLGQELISKKHDPVAAYPMNESSCHKFSGCQFRELCSKSPVVRHIFEENFERRQWNPLVPRVPGEEN